MLEKSKLFKSVECCPWVYVDPEGPFGFYQVDDCTVPLSFVEMVAREIGDREYSYESVRPARNYVNTEFWAVLTEVERAVLPSVIMLLIEQGRIEFQVSLPDGVGQAIEDSDDIYSGPAATSNWSGRLSKKVLLAVPSGLYLASNVGCPPIFAETIAPTVSGRLAQWARILEAGADGRRCHIFDSKHHYDEYIKGIEF
jgi:hypothetical protein